MHYGQIKRLLDIFLSIIGLMLTTPLLIITAIAIKIESHGPVIFKQNRLGLQGKVFCIYKFRSMYENAEKDGVYVRKGDLRVTKVGAIIRKASVDELPQLLNVIKGDMSLIGPRPPLTYHPWTFEEYTQEQKVMFDVRPGITGLAQINGRKQLDWSSRIAYNQEYVSHMSFRTDVSILLKTVIKVCKMDQNVTEKETVDKKIKHK